MISPSSPRNDAKFAQLSTDLEHSRREAAKASMLFSQQEALIFHMKDSEQKKEAKIKELEIEMQTLMRQHQQDLYLTLEEGKTTQMELEHKVRFLELEVSRLTEENTIYIRFEFENKELRQTMLNQQEQMEKIQNLNEELRSKTRDDMMEFKSEFEEEFKRRLSESEKRFQAEAYRALTEEAKLALQGTDHLQIVLEKQNDSIEAVLQRCKQLEQAHARVKMEQELSHQNFLLQQQEGQKLRRQLGDSKAKCDALEESVKQRRIERASLELLYLEYEATRKDNQRLQDKLRRTQRAADRWRNRAVMAVNEASGQADKSTKAIGWKGRSNNSRPAEGLWSRGTATSEGTTTTDTEGEDYATQGSATETDGETTNTTTADGTTKIGTSFTSRISKSQQIAKKVDPISVLSMWNVHYENWRPSSPSNVDTTCDSIAQSSPAAKTMIAPEKTKLAQIKTSADDWRLENDRKLSVLSRRRLKTLPPQQMMLAASRSHKERQAAQLFTIKHGSVSFSASKPSGRFLVP